jgi:LysR family transcriptional regulator, low CO2-responsive transcriptional regulator
MKQIPQSRIPLDSRQLNAFVTLVQTGNFAETGRRLFLTQSAISHSMRALESEMGCRLFVRMRKSIVPTEAGEALLHHAQLGLMEFAKGREMLDHLKEWGSRRFRIGAPPLLARCFLPSIMVELRRQHPRLVVTIKVRQPSYETESLENGELDCVLGPEPLQHSEIDFTPLFNTPWQIVVPEGHRWVQEGRVPIDELSREPCLLPERSSPVRGLIDRHFSRENIVLNCVAEVEYLETVRELLKAGMGIGILPSWIVQEELRAGSLRAFPAGRRPLCQGWGLRRWKQRAIDSIESDFRILCAAAARSFPAP